MGIGLVVRVTIVPGKNAEFEEAFARQAAGVRANEPGNKLYQLVKSREDPNGYVVMELYDDEAAIAAHRDAPHMVENRPVIGPLIGGKTVVEIYDTV